MDTPESILLTALASGLHIVGIALALHALCKRHTPQGSIAWILGLTMLPWISIPLYMVLGVGRIKRHTSHRHSRESIANFLKCHGAWRSPQSRLSRTLCNCTGYAPCSANAATILRDGNATYRDLLQAIRNAKDSILLEFFIIRNDRVGNALKKALEEQAAKGVRVYVIYDEVGSHKLPIGFLKSLRRFGVCISSFNGKRFWLSSILRINYRNHRKLVVIDGETAYLGSLNIGLEYLQGKHRPYWRDTFVKLRGPIVCQCLISFLDDWKRATGEQLKGLDKHPAPVGPHSCQLITSGPDDHPVNLWQLTLLELAAASSKKLWLASPYFVPTSAVKEALCAAALRGVDVRILIPHRGDNTAAQLAMYTFIPEMLACGVRMLAYEPGFLHEKVCVMDGGVSCIGTANLDTRSLRLNFELTLLLEDTDLTQQLTSMLEEDMSQARAITPAQWYKAPFPTRLLANCCRLLSPTL